MVHWWCVHSRVEPLVARQRSAGVIARPTSMSRPTSAASTGSSGRPQPRLGFRVFSFRHRATDRHSFLVGNDQGGVTDVLGHLPVDRDHTTIADLRIPLETVEERGMLKRSPLFAEVLYVMNATQNLHGRPESERRQYRFARIRADEADKPDPYPKKVFTLEEEEKVIVKSCQPVLLIVPCECCAAAGAVACMRCSRAPVTVDVHLTGLCCLSVFSRVPCV